MLEKNTLVTFVPGSPGQQIIAAQPASPARIGRFAAGVTGRFVNFPATAAVPGVQPPAQTPAQWLITHNLGWNAGAYSVKRLNGDAYVSFKIPGAAGVIVGFNHVSSGVDFSEIAHGIYFQAGVARVYESGAPKGEVLSFVPTDIFIIERVNQQVSYYRQVVGEAAVRMYQSSILSIRSIIVDTSMYAGGDRID